MRLDGYVNRTGAVHYAARFPEWDGQDNEPTGFVTALDVANLKQLPPTQDATHSAISATPGSGTTVVQFPRTQRTSEPQRFGDVQPLPLVIGVADLIALPVAPTQRTYCKIMNVDPANTLFYNWGTAASSSNGIPLQPGQDETFTQFVPQNELHLSASAAGTLVMVMSSNKNDNT